MNREQEIRNLRIDKIARLKDAGMEAYVDPGSIKQDLTLKEAEKQFSELEKSSEEKTIVGRIMIKRGVGKISFTKLFDGTGEFQVVLRVDELGKERMKTFEKLFDIGDFAEFTGTFFTTERGQESLLVSNFRMLTKALLPLPEKWHGLEDIEEKYRKRYLDILTNEDARKRFVIRARVISEIRSILDAENFLEVETPVLQNQASGAMAETFNTHHNDYDLDVVLRISLEAEHKMIMAGGYPAVYEIGKNFRNEGSDSTHIQEFTMIEWYKAYKGLDYNMDLTEKMLKSIAEKIIGKTKFEIENFAGDIVKIDFGGEWKRVEFNKLIMEHANIDLETATRDELEAKAIELGEKSAEAKKMSEWNLMDSIWKKSARRKIVNPTWVTRYPGNLKPLAIQNDNGTAEVAQLVMAGFELSNHYAELVNPIAQRKLLEEQVAAKSDGDVEAMEMNNSFIEAMEYGMPPMTGTGIGIDRLVGIFTEQNNLRDTIIFPLMKPRGVDNENGGKAKDTKIAVVLINKSSKMEAWQEMNTVAHLNASFASREGRKLLEQDTMTTKDEEKIKLNIQHAIMIKEAENNDDLINLISKTKDAGLEVVEFTRDMIEATDDSKLIEGAKNKNMNEFEYLGVLIFGKMSVVNKLTKEFDLYER
jgi:lysyl-tRNA synthetase class 2